MAIYNDTLVKKNGNTYYPRTTDISVYDADGKPIRDKVAKIKLDSNGNPYIVVLSVGGRKANTTVGTNSFTAGTDNEASGPNSQSFGLGAKATAAAQFAMGQYNTPDDDALLIIGNGSSDSARANAAMVNRNGQVYAGADFFVGSNVTYRYRGEISSAQNFNSILMLGLYKVPAGAINCPWDYCMLEVLAAGDMIVQRCTSVEVNETMQRYAMNGGASWSPWKNINNIIISDTVPSDTNAIWIS